MTSDEKISVVGKNIQEKATVIWNVANSLFGAFKPHEYGLVILPMVVVKRFHDCLLPTHQQVLDTYEKVKSLQVIDGFLRNASGYPFYNISPFTFETLLADPANINDNFRAYLNGFSDNVQDILARMDFYTQIKRMEEADLLYQVVSDFCTDKADMRPEKISAVDMGYIFENLVQKFSESYNEQAGAHFTSRDIIYLMCDLLLEYEALNTDENDFTSRTVYDMTMGTSQMLTCMEERIKQLDSDAEVTLFGQEINPFTFGLAKSDALIRGGSPDNMQFGDTLSDDKFSDYQFDFAISNPPFGIDWKREAKAVEAEHKQGEAGRFAPGLPPKSDGQMLFMLNGLKKLKDTGRMAIIQNGSPLFSGDAASGPSEIRRYLIENDWLDAIVQLSTDAFYNTGITTYIWLVSKNKPAEHRGNVQLIDASKCFEARRKSIGNKRNDITEACRNLIVQAYGEYKDGVYTDTLANGTEIVCESRVLDSVSFGYNKITVESPKLDDNGEKILKKNKPVADSAKRDTENVPLDEDIDAYFEREVLPYKPDAWIDKAKTKVGYEIPFTRTFYKYQAPESVDTIMERIKGLEQDIAASLDALFPKEG